MLQMCGKVVGGLSMLSEVLVRTAPKSDGDVCFELRFASVSLGVTPSRVGCSLA